ncbi:MAG: carboxypeptidase-like regulatory domain-containing protein [Algibacter sp.]|uniref:carboxypeptidase-like regulatory domain-containing protein n=1 Tax=Algibacter sp. TaxID=1872428 RepID=UPI00263660D2|nr:carboxypeptidase-like regulatory domain-containing protein [Algibacter sp.]MDG1730989.1 carboxypeptidase-like regulatory domain-containing protein [Algibacter sp.]MDG2179896.1 carboxypeptidase-like regulatory domain-containing protein [Algibacter sp.]
MNKLTLILLFGIFSISTYSQQTIVKGSVLDAVSLQPILNVKITLEGTTITTLTDVQGEFIFSSKVPFGEQILKISKSGYIIKRFPIIVNEGKTVDISGMTLERDLSQSQDLFTITLSDDELDNDASGADNITGLLSSSLDVFQRTAAFEFSQSFFRLRGLDSENGSVLINGISMNKLYSGRPQWSNWGGLNDVMRNQELTTGLSPSSYNFGGVLGTTNINVRASEARAGGRITYSSSNRSYTNRFLATYASGLLGNNWAYTISLGRRWGNEGYQDATLYDANSFFLSVEKKLNDKHSLNFTGMYAPNRRGKSSPNTQEVFDLKDIKYNEYWGWLDGEKRNSRIKKVEEPIFMLNHYWDLSSKTALNTNVAYQFGKLGNSRLDNNGTDLVNGFPEGGGSNPSPAYYQKLPSYFERNFPEDLGFAYRALKEFEDSGQIDWNTLYQANISNTQTGGNAIYALYEDRVDDTQFTINSILNTEINDNVVLNTAVNYQRLKSENYAQVLDLLGAKTYLDIDQFATAIDEAQNDLQNPNRLVREGDTFKYNYNVFAEVLNAYVQTEFTFNKLDFYMSLSVSNTQYQREGMYQNGAFPDNSLGKGKKLSFTGFGAKSGVTYKLSGKHLFTFNGGYISRAPALRNTYSNSRENHNIVPNITNEKILTTDASYIFRSPIIKAKITGYYTKIEDANEISFFFADGIGGDNVAFVQEILQGVDKQHLGAELGIEAQVTPTIKLKGVASIGQFTYANNPNLYLTTEADEESVAAGFVNGFKEFGQSKLKDYKIAAGPHRAYSVGFEYRDPDFWWFGATANFLTNTYIDISPLTRSINFTTDFDGNVFNDYDEDLARKLLKQERFDDYMVVNLVGGKSWKIGGKYVSVFASVNNLLDEVFKTGGFEQGRNANYRELRDDKSLNTQVFGSKYWYGRGATYFLNLNYSF